MSPREIESNAFAGMPQWARIVWIFGAPSILAGVLVWRLIAGIEDTVEASLSQMTDTHAALMQHVRATEDAARLVQAAQMSQISVMRQICVNTAKDDQQRRECVR